MSRSDRRSAAPQGPDARMGARVAGLPLGPAESPCKSRRNVGMLGTTTPAAGSSQRSSKSMPRGPAPFEESPPHPVREGGRAASAYKGRPCEARLLALICVARGSVAGADTIATDGGIRLRVPLDDLGQPGLQLNDAATGENSTTNPASATRHRAAQPLLPEPGPMPASARTAGCSCHRARAT